MKQDDINEAEWRNPANWSGPGRFGIYASKRDTRLWVPKGMPAMGFTINCAHPATTRVIVAVALLPLVLLLAQKLVA